MRGGRETDEQQSRGGIAETWYGAAPVVLIAIRALLLSRDTRAVRAQPWTTLA
jgi:hypothetical protein